MYATRQYTFASQFVGVVPGIALTLGFHFAAIPGAHVILKAAFPGLYPTDTIGSLVVQDGNGIAHA